MSRDLDLSSALIVCPADGDRIVIRAATVLSEEVEARTGIALPVHAGPAPAGAPAIVVSVGAPAATVGREGYAIAVGGAGAPVVTVTGADPRGCLYGVGRLLRGLALGPGFVRVDPSRRISSAPAAAIRGIQLGYRPKNNTFDAWQPRQFDHHIRELALWGANAIEILPPRTDDEALNSLMPLSPAAMMVELARIIDSYGLDVWVWYPNVGPDHVSPAGVRAELAEREAVFRSLVRLDALLKPAGDPGALDPDALFAFSEREAALLRRLHPGARYWIAPQNFHATAGWRESFYRHVQREPAWLDGIVFGAWWADGIAELRGRIPSRYPIRFYPDIAHSFDCQFAVPDWDLAFALTEGRECPNPRPAAMKRIHALHAPFVAGSICYSEGVNDDVNKFVWLDQDWDPQARVEDTLADYARMFLAPERAGEIVRGILRLERNWEGSLAQNDGVEATLLHWEAIEREATPRLRSNWRFKLLLLRAGCDAYVRRRLLRETALQERALRVLRDARAGAREARELDKAVDAAGAILAEARETPVAADLRSRCFRLGDELFETIGYQLTVGKHGGQSIRRGAFLDAIDEPLNDATWLRARFAESRAAADRDGKRAVLGAILDRTDPGTGGYFDDFATTSSRNRVRKGKPWADDPQHLASPLVGFRPGYAAAGGDAARAVPYGWHRYVTTFNDTPLVVAYDGIDPDAGWKLRIVYAFGMRPADVRLAALEPGGRVLLHDAIPLRDRWQVVELSLPREAYSDGRLQLEWTNVHGGNTGCVCEIALRRHGRPGA